MKKKDVIYEEKNVYDGNVQMHPANEEAKKVDLEHITLAPSSKEESKAINEETAKFEKLIKKSDRVLLRIKAVFPFEFFPDVVIIDEAKINVIHKIFFRAGQIQSIPITHVQDVEVDTSVLFATLKILPTGFSVVGATETWLKIRYLWRRDAIRARRIIAGLLIASREGIDLTKVESVNFVNKIEELGTVS